MSVLPEKILVATDGSERAARATRTAAELAEKLGAELHVIHVGSRPSSSIRRCEDTPLSARGPSRTPGSSDSVAHHAHCPVLVVRAEEG